MLWVLIFCAILQLAHGSCPSQCPLYRDGQCRSSSRYDYYGMAMNDALNRVITYCNNIGAKPVSIHDDEQLSYWKARKTSYYFPIGLKCNNNSKKWEWADGTTLDFRPPSGNYDNELDADCKTGCSWFLNEKGEWHIDCGTASNSCDVFCIKQLTPPVASTDCGNFIDGEDMTEMRAENWNDAEAICHSFGAEFTSIHSAEQNAYIRRLATSRGAVNGVLLGGIVSGKSNDFGWIDGSDWDYSNFYPNFPIDGLGACLSMDTVTTAGQWMNTDCTAKLPVVCSRPLDSAPAPVCSEGPWKEGQVIYSPGFPNNASVPCDYFLTVATGKKVNVHIMVLEANSCCDRLILTDGYIGGTVVANLTGEVSDKWYHTSTSNTMRVSWQPNGGVNVRGVMMSFTIY